MKESSSISYFAGKISGIASRAAALGEVIDEQRLVKKFLLGMDKKYIQIVASIEQSIDLKKAKYDEVVGRLLAYEERINH